MLLAARLFLLTKADCDHVHHSFRFRHRERQPECHIEPGAFAAGRALEETLCLSSAASTRLRLQLCSVRPPSSTDIYGNFESHRFRDDHSVG